MVRGLALGVAQCLIIRRERRMPNAKDATVSDQHKILLVGGPGVGKTSQVITLPGKKFLYAFDPNVVASIRGHDVEYEEFVPSIDDLDLSVKTLKKDVGDKTTRKVQPKTYLRWEEDFERRVEEGFFNSVDWLILDSFTTWSETIMDRVQFLAGRLGKHPEQADWTSQMATITNVFRVITNLPCNFLCTAHSEIKMNDDTKKVYGQIMMTGRLRLRLPLLFTEIFACHCTSDAKGIGYQIQTRPDRENPVVRSSIPGLDMFEDMTIQDMSRPQDFGIGALLRNLHGDKK